MRKTQEIMNNLKKLNAERNELFEKLDCSLAIQSLWPEAFEHGMVICSLAGSYTRIKDLKLKITNGKGEVREYDLKDVPPALQDRHLEIFTNRLNSLQQPRFKRDLQRYLKGE